MGHGATLARAFLVVVVVALAGCAGVPATLRPAERDVAAFAVAARVAVREGERGMHASLDWAHAPERDDILITTPLGQGIARLTRDGEGARLQTADGKTYRDASLDGLAAQVFGVPVPLARMADWILGRPDGADAVRRDALGRAAVLDAAGWRVEYDYPDTSPQALPSRLELSRGEIALRVLISQWELR